MIHLFGIFENLLHLEDDRIRDLAMYQCLQPDIMQIVVNSLSGEPSVASAALDMIEWWMKRRKYLENLSPLVANLSLELNQLLLYGKDGALVKKSIRIVGFTAQEGTFLCRLPKGSFAVTDPSSHGKHWGDQFTLNIWRLYFEPIYQEDVIRATKALLAIASDNIRGHLYQQNIVEALKELVESNLDVVVIFGLMARDEPARIELIEKEIAHKMINLIDNNKLAEDRLSIRNAIIELCSPVVQTTLPESSRVHGFVRHVMKVVTQKLHDCTATQDCYGIVKRVLSNIKIPIVGVFDLSSNMDDLKALLRSMKSSAERLGFVSEGEHGAHEARSSAANLNSSTQFEVFMGDTDSRQCKNGDSANILANRVEFIEATLAFTTREKFVQVLLEESFHDVMIRIAGEKQSSDKAELTASEERVYISQISKGLDHFFERVTFFADGCTVLYEHGTLIQSIRSIAGTTASKFSKQAKDLLSKIENGRSASSV
ncbi:hypothetical protein RhiJN_05286 [Ceratobasidium sp. AG-Ba]|nr:hypothetical protein RhiJN_05286 [Ceratobasidium sp. AG-Ba]